MKRREFLKTSASAAMASSLIATNGYGSAKKEFHQRGKADHCIMIWLGGGMAHIDTFDPKLKGDAKAKKAGSYYDAIPTAVPDIKVCEHLAKTAKVMDRVTAVRTVFHNVVDEHGAATNRMHTGRPTSGTVQYPSLGSIVANQRGAANPNVPAYMVIGYPNLVRGPGFLGQDSGFVYLTDLKTGPAGLARAKDLTASRQRRREELLNTVRNAGKKRFEGDKLFQNYDTALAQSLKISGPDFMKVFNLDAEPAKTRDEYGDGFGQRCLLARRLFQRGVRFVEVSHNMNFRNGTGWDTHNDGQLKQHLLIRELDRALSAMIHDLEKHKMLDRTLIVISSEFGRPAQFDSGGGRGHHSKCFSVVLAGGGLKHTGGYGVSDDLAMKIVENPVSIPDLFATVLTALKINPAKNLFDGNRPVPMTDNGRAIEELFG